jgi:hypothetical protein
MEFKTYKVISPGKVGAAMTKGWTPVAAINFEEMLEGVGQFSKTRFLIGKGLREGAQAARGAGPTPVLMYPQPAAEDAEEPVNTNQVQQLLDRIALMSEEDVLALHAELQAKAAAPAPTGDAEVDEVTEAMDELLGQDDEGDDGTDDDDDE